MWNCKYCYKQALSEVGIRAIWQGPQIVFDLTLDIYGISGFVVATLLKRNEKCPSIPLRNKSLQLHMHSMMS